jgi:hypothetical protein
VACQVYLCVARQVYLAGQDRPGAARQVYLCKAGPTLERIDGGASAQATGCARNAPALLPSGVPLVFLWWIAMGKFVNEG